MGLAISSFVRETYFSLKAFVLELRASNAESKAILERICSSPGLPAACPTRAFWQEEDVLFPELVDRRSEVLPERADFVVVGSGVTGCAVVCALLKGLEWERDGAGKEERNFKVVMLEARSVCSGATGRNGGHVKLAPYEVYRGLKARFGPGRARHIVEFQRRHLGLLLEMAEAEGFLEASEVREVDTVDLFVDEEAWKEAVGMVEELRTEWKEGAADIEVSEGPVAREVCSFPFLG